MVRICRKSATGNGSGQIHNSVVIFVSFVKELIDSRVMQKSKIKMQNDKSKFKDVLMRIIHERSNKTCRYNDFQCNYFGGQKQIFTFLYVILIFYF